MALVTCPNCKTQVTEVSARCYSCGYPMPRKIEVAAPKRRTGLHYGYLAGALLVVAGFLAHERFSAGIGKFMIVAGVVAFAGVIVARVFLKWLDKPMQP